MVMAVIAVTAPEGGVYLILISFFLLIMIMIIVSNTTIEIYFTY
jgi:hypothetical protein